MRQQGGADAKFCSADDDVAILDYELLQTDDTPDTASTAEPQNEAVISTNM